MARRKKKGLIARMSAPKLPELNIDSDTKKSILIVFIFAFGAISFLSLFGLAGVLGKYLYIGMSFVFGWGKPIFPLALLAIGFFLYNGDKYEIRGSRMLGLILFIISAETLLHSFVGQTMWETAIDTGEGGGYIGLFFISTFYKIMGFWAGLIVTIGLMVISLMLLFDTTLLSMFGQDSWFGKILYPINFLFNKLFNRQQEEEGEEEEEEENEEGDEEESEEDSEEENEEEDESDDEGDEEKNEDEEDEQVEKEKKEKKIVDKKAEIVKMPDVWWEPTGMEIEHSLALLSPKKGKPMSGDTKEATEIIKHSLENFGIPIEMGEISVGPTVTQYTFKPADGVKLSRITTLSNDLALALAAHPIRIEAPIPGKALVGIEVPNHTKAMVGLREILSDKAYIERQSNLMIALGKDVSGKAWLYDVARMPHLLVAGATNSGKSVCLHSIILSLLYQNNPDELKFIMVDPKRLELPIYNGIPYLLTPVITDVSKTVNALKWCLNEMDRRLDILSQKHKRNIQSYNETSKVKMPYIIFIIDELADLMMVSGKEVEAGIIRLAQLARAVGIHLILATQRPSVDVITGLIKANMPARIAFSVASGTDSRTILDSLGAEKLLGRGDMLFSTAELSKPKRIQGAYVSDIEIKKIIRNIKDQCGEFEYVEGITDKQKVGGIAGMGMGNEMGSHDDEDELLGEAKEIVVNMGKASASLLQRRLSIGYARAARLLDLLEQMGVVGPSNGAKPREIMISKEQYEAMVDQGVSGVSLHSREDSVAPDAFLPNEDEDDEESEEESDEDEQSDDIEDAEDNDENEDESLEDENSENKENEAEDSDDKKPEKTDKNVKRLIVEKPDGFDKFFSR